MQLDLFEDNRPGILLNMADEYLRAHDFEKAILIFVQVLQEYPQNRQALELEILVKRWIDNLATLNPPNCNPLQIKTLVDNIETITHIPLKTALLEIMLEMIALISEPDSIYLPPRFHRGHLLLMLGKHDKAADSFLNALKYKELPQGRFMAWRADAMALGGNYDDTIPLYLQTFITDSATVDAGHFKHRTINALFLDLSFNVDGIDKDDEIAWLPVWGWLHGIFQLPLQTPPIYEELEISYKNSSIPLPLLWYKLLTVAEQRRTLERNDRQMAAVRRLMKNLNRDMFEFYMQKIIGNFS